MNGRYEDLRDAMIELHHEFDRAAAHFPGLFHDLLIPEQQSWNAFIEANAGADVWEPHPDHRTCSRFYGALDGLTAC